MPDMFDKIISKGKDVMSGEKQNKIYTVCPSCHAAYKVPDIVIGKEVTCKKCSTVFEVIKFIPDGKYPLLGKIAVENRLIKKTDLVEALSILKAEKQNGKKRTLEKILLEKKMIAREVLDNLVTATTRQLDKEFGVLVIKKNLVSKNDVNEALKAQAQHFKKNRNYISIDNILIHKGLLSEEKCNDILKLQQRIKEKTEATNLKSEQPHNEEEPQETQVEKEEKEKDRESDIAEAGSRVEVYKDKKFFQIRQMDKEFVQIAMDNSLISKEEGEKALKKQLSQFEESKIRRIVGDILVNINLITKEDRDSILIKQKRINKKDTLFCDIAVKKGFLSKEIAEKIQSGLRDRLDNNKGKKPVDDLLIKMELLTREQCDEITKALARYEDEGFEDEAFKVNTRIKISGIELQLMVTEDGLKAYLIRNTDLPETFTIADIKEFLAEQKIVYGIVDDTLIQGFIQYEGQKNERFKIAEGKPVKKGRAGSIRYYFETEHLKVGAMKKGGQIDFKDRGEIPHVSKGDLIAEKIPMIKGEQGIDIYARPIPILEIKDLSLRGGKGVELSDDGLKMYSKVDGQPDASIGGKISVLQELKIPGDVGFETGHVEFDGNVHVSGTIQDGFRVRAANLIAQDIMAADIETTGDIEVKGGITGSTIKTQGGVKGKYFKNVTISAFKDIIVQKEIIDSKIETSGTAIVQSGKIMSSEITAKNGIESMQIGTDISVPCKLKIGVDVHGEIELNKLNDAISEFMENKEALQKKVAEYKAEEEQSHMDIADLAQVQDKATVGQRSLEAKLVELKEKGDKNNVADIEAVIKELAQKAQSADEEISALFEKQDKLSEEQAEVLNQVKEIDAQIQELEEKKEALLDWSNTGKGDASVKVRDLLYERTVIMGSHTRLVLNKSYKNSQVKEIRVGSTGDDSDWEMRVIT